MMEQTMRTILTVIGAATLLAAFLATPAFSQQTDGFGHAIKQKRDFGESHQPARNDRAYKSALDQIPDASNKYDPWGRVRPQSSTGTAQSK
jgi:hypothetical protein